MDIIISPEDRPATHSPYCFRHHCQRLCVVACRGAAGLSLGETTMLGSSQPGDSFGEFIHALADRASQFCADGEAKGDDEKMTRSA